jgi:aminopeptidase N
VLDIALGPARAGDTLRVTVRYGGEVRDGLVMRTDSLGRWMAFGDNWPDRGRHWIPSVDHPSDKATVTWIVNAPSERRVVANGELVEETPLPAAGGRRARTRTRWRESRPIPVYGMVIAAAPLAYYDLGRTACGMSELPGCVPQAVYVFPESRDFLPGPFAAAPAMVEWFSRLVAPYPYERLAHLQSSTIFGGMENPTAIFYGDQGIRRRTMQTGLVAHESAHMWFGNSVTPREWGHLWLSEGFASYWAQLWVQHERGDSAFRAGMARLRDEIVASTVTAARPVLDTAQAELTALLNTNSYQKGAWVLHMLRGLVGDSAFFRGVRRYYEAHRHGTALTSDLQSAMEADSGMPLAWYFDQWLRRPGVAEVRWTSSYEPKTRRVYLSVEQTARAGPYRFPLTIELTSAAGDTRRVTVEVPASRAARVELPLALDAPPARMRFDPDVALLAIFQPK